MHNQPFLRSRDSFRAEVKHACPPITISRRSFSLLAALSLSALLGLSLPRDAQAAEGLTFEVYADKAGEFRWRLKARNGEILATTGQGYKAKADAKAGVARLQKNLDKLTFEIYEDAKHETRWRLKARNGQIVAASSEGYKARADAERAIERIKAGAKDATVTDET